MAHAGECRRRAAGGMVRVLVSILVVVAASHALALEEEAPPPATPFVDTLPAFQFVPLKAKKKRKSQPPVEETVIEEAATPAVLPLPSLRPATRINEDAAEAPADADSTLSAPPLSVMAPLKTSVPEEFEELLQANTTLVDVYYGGDFLLTTLAEYTVDTLAFSEPTLIVSRIPNVIGRLALSNRLTGPVPTNSDQLCPASGASKACGALQPSFIGIIFDESRFRVDLFVHPDMLMAAPSVRANYLPSPHADVGYSLVQNLSAVASEDVTGSTSHTISGHTHVAKGMQRLYANWASTDYQDFSVEEFAWQRDTHKHAYTAGVFRARSDAISFTKNNYLAGAEFGRSLKTRTDIEQALGSEILIFLSSRSQVDVFRDGRLVSTGFYPVGNQLLDTSRLESGVYDIDIRITDASGNVRTQRRFFNKSNRLAPRGIPLYHVSGGLVVQPDRREVLPQNDGNWQIQGGYQTRWREDLGWNLAGAATDTHALLEGGVTWLQALFQVGVQNMVSTQGDYGWSAHVFGRYAALSGTASYRRLWARFGPGESVDYQLVEPRASQQYASLSYPFLAGMLQASADVSRSTTGNSELYALRYLRPWVTSWLPPANLTFEVANQDGDLFAQVGIEIRHIGKRMSYGGSLYGTQTDRGNSTESGAMGTASMGWRDGDLRPEDIEVQARATIDDSSTVVGVEGVHASYLGRAQLGVENINGNAGNGSRIAATFDTNVAANKHGISWGGQQLAPAVVILDIRGAAGQGVFDVMVDGYRVAGARAGERNVLPLPPYGKYQIQLVDRGTNFVAYDDRLREVTLYPGSVETLRWDVESIIVGVGRIIIEEKVCSNIDQVCYDVRTPLRSAVISGASGFAMTDEDGRFQVEMTSGTKRLHARRRSIECDLALEKMEMFNSIAKLGDLVCRVESGAVEATDEARQESERRRRDNDPVGGMRIDQAIRD